MAAPGFLNHHNQHWLIPPDNQSPLILSRESDEQGTSFLSALDKRAFFISAVWDSNYPQECGHAQGNSEGKINWHDCRSCKDSWSTDIILAKSPSGCLVKAKLLPGLRDPSEALLHAYSFPAISWLLVLLPSMELLLITGPWTWKTRASSAFPDVWFCSLLLYWMLVISPV